MTIGLFGPVVIEPMRRLEIDPLAIAIFAAVTVGAFVLGRLRPTWAVALLFLTDEIEWTHVHASAALSISVLVSAAVGIAFLTQPKLVRTLRRPAVRIVGTGFAAMALATLLSAVVAERRDLVLLEGVKLLEYAITFLIAHAAFAERRNDRLAFDAMAIAAIVVSASALVQLLTGAPSGFALGSIVVPRVAGLLGGPNQLAGYLGLLFPMLLLAFVERRSRLAGPALVILAAALVFTLSRAGLFGVAVATLVVVQWRPFSGRLRAVVVGGVGAFCVLAGLTVFSGGAAHLASADDVARPDGLGTRTQLWHAALALFEGSPMFGVGAGNFEERLASVGYPQLHTHANSWYFEALADGGLVLLTATVVWIRSAFVAVARFAQREPLALGALAATAGFAAHGLFDDLVFYPTVAGTWWLIVGVAAGSSADGENASRSESASLV